MKRKTTRRRFLKAATATGLGCTLTAQMRRAIAASPNEKLGVACIGAGGRGAGNVGGVSNERIVAFCDVDDVRAAKTYKKYPSVPKVDDFRQLFDKFHKDIDAVTVSTPDHMHAMITLMAMGLGKHVYCEKPLTRTVHEARQVADAARKSKVATQMGNGGMSRSGARRNMELIRAGVVGPIREVHAWTDRPAQIWKQGIERPKDAPDVPETLQWNLWLGIAPKRPYHPAYVPSKWRGWYDFGTGALGDMACHICNVAFWGLELKDPIAVSAETSPRFKETFPAWSRVTWEFGARGSRPPVKFHWYDGGQMPAKQLFEGHELVENGSLLIGDKGKLYIPNPNGARTVLLPEKAFKDLTPPPQTLPDSPGHHEEWIEACKTGKQAMSHFAYAGAMTESLLLGNIAIRCGQRIEWDAKTMRITNVPEANQYVNPPQRKGW